MPYYMLQATYAPQARARFVHNPQDRREAFRAMAESNGGTFIDSWLSFVDHDDVVMLFEMPDEVRAAVSGGVAAMASGALRSLKTTPLMTLEEGLEALRGAPENAHRPSGESG